MRYFIAGPCAIESVDQFVGFAGDLVRLFERFPSFRLVYKGSFDKANRTQQGSPRGVGLVEAQVAWYNLRRYHPDLMVTTDVHETWQASEVDVDVLQIPAMLGRQTPLLEAAAATGKIVNVKKPQWEGSAFYADARGKLDGAKEVWFTHRGSPTTHGLDVGLNELIEMSWRLSAQPAFLDLTHTNRGNRHHSRPMARAARAIGINNFFAEVHPEPDRAICDGSHQLTLGQLEYLLMDLDGQL
jgi:2-dehydro-3-deoxyphosphooctonate aldolase (KDO 8-P synthase)